MRKDSARPWAEHSRSGRASPESKRAHCTDGKNQRRHVRATAALFAAAFTITAHATVPCPHDPACEIPIEDSVAIYAELVAITRVCAERDAANASRYDLGLRREIESESRSAQDRLKLVQKSPDLPRRVQAAYDAIVTSKGSSWRHDCEALLKSANAVHRAQDPSE